MRRFRGEAENKVDKREENNSEKSLIEVITNLKKNFKS